MIVFAIVVYLVVHEARCTIEEDCSRCEPPNYVLVVMFALDAIAEVVLLFLLKSSGVCS